MTETKLDRDCIKTWVQQHIASLEAGDIASFMAGIHADINVIWPRTAWAGWDQVQASLAQQINETKAIRFYLRRLLIDVQQSVAGVEWVCRYVDQNTNMCHEFLGGAALDFTGEGQLYRCQIHLDFDRSGVVSTLEAPWPQEQWSPGVDPGVPFSRTQSEQFLQDYAAAWSNHDAVTIGQLLHDEVYLCPPWAYREGKEEVEAIARYHFANFLDTQVTPQRIIFDESQPYFGICQQTFACTNPKTGLRGQDTDFAFFEICQGKLRYWRNYFDTGRSIQDDYKNMD
ncbi:MAG TPA: nuclear transport factor 2 family protein [Anaerolineae bacterium]|jgi:limonene-1,2-epoxide hydrolase